MTQSDVAKPDIEGLIHLNAEAASAFIRGDIRHYLSLIRHAEDYTLMPPFGGEPVRGFDGSDKYIAELERFFQGGEAEFEAVETYASGNLVVIAAIERQHGRIGGLPEQDLSLRVTLVFPRVGDTWLLAHRHADPLVHSVGLEQFAALARG